VWAAQGARFHSYVGQIESRSVLLAWGTTDGPNTIGRDSVSLGEATISIAGQSLRTKENWILVTGLDPDHTYGYSISVGNEKGSGTVRTFPEHATHLRFFVIGDYGTGLPPQREVAEAMRREYSRLASAGDAPRFVITTGDNIYADLNFGLAAVNSGSSDSDWESKFFVPYASMLNEIPFYPSPGNHDGNSSESRADLPAYLDNFFFPQNHPARWYTFQFADLAQFFSLDSTTNTLEGRVKPAFLPNGEQFKWFQPTLAASKAPWKIPYFHHPPFNAGPYHGASFKDLKAFCDAFATNGVKVVFSGHEHNFQFSDHNAATAGIQYLVSGAGGELRPGDVRGKMAKAHIAGWVAERHFLSVQIEGDEMRITPIGPKGTLEPTDPAGHKITMPLVVKR
jgi:Calcineurin-like phosphoesterase